MRKAFGAFFIGRGSQDGQAVVLIAITLLAMLMMVGVAIDAGQLYSARRSMQEAADAAAYAGAVVLYEGGTTTQAYAAATADATKNGYTAGGATILTVNAPSSGPHLNDPKYVEVLLQVSVRTALVPAEAGVSTVKVRAVAGAIALDASDAVLVLDQNPTSGAFSVASGGKVQIQNGSIMINSSSTTAGVNSGAAQLQLDAGFKTKVVGGLSGTWPSPLTGQNPQADPFAGYPRPSTTGMTVYTGAQSPGTINPGVYKTNANLGAGNWNFNPGIYIFAGTSITVTSGSLNGSGIMLFFTNSLYPATGGTCGALNLGNDGTSSLNPATSGTYKGMLVYFDPACTTGITATNDGRLETTTGTVYVPKGCVNMTNGRLQASHVVTKCISVGTNGEMDITYDSTTTANPIQPALAE